jgi:hypothetical protein
MQLSQCAELNEKSLKPKSQVAGELLEYLPTASPAKFGFVYSPSTKTPASAWLRIGRQCKILGCDGYGLGVEGTLASYRLSSVGTFKPQSTR